MSVLWRHRFTLPLLAVVMFLLGCDAQVHDEAPAGKLLYARGNHWAVASPDHEPEPTDVKFQGHLMGKKSVDEAPGPDRRDGDAEDYFVAAEVDRDTQTSRLLRALLTGLTGLTVEQRRPRVSRESDFNQAEDVLLLALNVRDADGG